MGQEQNQIRESCFSRKGQKYTFKNSKWREKDDHSTNMWRSSCFIPLPSCLLQLKKTFTALGQKIAQEMRFILAAFAGTVLIKQVDTKRYKRLFDGLKCLTKN